MFKFFKLKLKHRELIRVAHDAEGMIEQEFDRVQRAMNIWMAIPQAKILIEYLEAKIELARDNLEMNIEVIKNQERLEVYRDLISKFQEVKDSQQAQSKPSSD